MDVRQFELLRTRARELGRSAAQTRQLLWLIGELERAAQAGVEDLWSPAGIERYLELADRGDLRQRDARRPTSPQATARVRRHCLGIILRDLVGLPNVPVSALPPPPTQPAASTREQRHLVAQLQTLWDERRRLAAGRDLRALRSLALVSLAVDTGARSGELAAMSAADVDGHTAVLIRRPQAARALPLTERVAFSDATGRHLALWLERRQDLVDRLEGEVQALWVSVWPNHSGGVRRPAGLPLQPRGIARAYRDAVEQINDRLAGAPGWVPLPLRLEPIRRGTTQAVASAR